MILARCQRFDDSLYRQPDRKLELAPLDPTTLASVAAASRSNHGRSRPRPERRSVDGRQRGGTTDGESTAPSPIT